MALASALVTVMLDAVRKTARPMMRDFGEVSQLQVSRKGPGDFVTAADLKAEETLFELLTKARPGYGFLGEERGMVEGTDKSHTWIVDPIDGTTNFANGIPLFAVSIAYLIEHEPVIGVVYTPITDESFYAARGAGAWLNDMPLPLRKPAARLKEAVAGVDFKRISHHLGDELAVRPPYYSQRNFGSSALEWCFVAAGRLDVYVHGGQMLWDYAAGRLILAEAGGQAEALDGGQLMSGPAIKRGVIAAASPALFAEWSAWIKARS